MHLECALNIRKRLGSSLASKAIEGKRGPAQSPKLSSARCSGSGAKISHQKVGWPLRGKCCWPRAVGAEGIHDCYHDLNARGYKPATHARAVASGEESHGLRVKGLRLEALSLKGLRLKGLRISYGRKRCKRGSGICWRRTTTTIAF